MGLFSFQKTSVPKSAIPEDILAAVRVNGEIGKTNTTPFVPQQSSFGNSAPSSTSPFLQKEKQEEKPTPAEPTLVTPAAESPTSSAGIFSASPFAPSVSPKPFQFSSQPPASESASFSGQAPKIIKAESLSSGKPDSTQNKALEEKQNTPKELLTAHLHPLTPPAPIVKKPFFSVTNIISLLVFILILGLISGGSWYYLNTRSTEEDVSPEESIGALEMQVPEPSLEAKTILVDQPNYLTINIETITLAEIKGLLEQESQKMKAEGVATPVEYLVVDTNNNPVAFSRFALLIGADTPQDLMEASLEPFSLYLYLDRGELRLALAVALRAETPANFPVNKAALPASMKKFFYPDEFAGINMSEVSFSQTTYQNNSISYTNIDIAKNFSFDMSLQEGILTFANSKNTIRAVIDKRLVVSGE